MNCIPRFFFFFFFFFFKFSSKVHSLLLNSFTFYLFILPSDDWLISAHNHGRILGGGGGGGGGGKFKIRHRTGIRWKS